MKKNFIRLVSILFLILLFTNCKSVQTEFYSTENVEDKNTKTVVIYCYESKEVYYLEDEREIKNILNMLPKALNILHILYRGYVLNSRTYYSYSMYLKNNVSIQKEILISTDNHVWTYKDGFVLYYFSPKNIEKIISKMYKGIKHTETIEDPLERRKYIEGLRADDNVLYINLQGDFDLRMGSFCIYVPASKDENIDSREIEDNLREHYGDTVKTRNKAIHNYSFPKRTRYIEETQEIEFEMRWTKEMYDKLDIYRKSEFSDDNYKGQQIFEYYTKD